METIITNARLVLEDRVVDGTIVLAGPEIRAVDIGRTSLRGAIDAEGDFLSPGLVEMHTDNLERHFVPRPNVVWPNGLAAALAHDAQLAAAGVTTVYDAVSVGTYDDPDKGYRRQICGGMITAVRAGVAGRHFRIDHRIHLRCELSSPSLLEDLEPLANEPLVQLASLMDHTPGQRQWRNVDDLKPHFRSEKKSAAEIDRMIRRRVEQGHQSLRANWDRAVSIFRDRGVPVATHDDTTEDHVAEAVAAGARISEFPTTLEAARAARAAGLAIVAGAPNLVRGGSHSGGAAVHDLAAEGLVDALSSDYVPASLLQALFRLDAELELPLHEGIGLLTWRVAEMVGLADRGRLRPGFRADLVRFRFADATPIVREVFVAGRRVL